MRLHILQDISVSHVNLVLVNRNKNVQYTLESNENKLHINKEPVRHVSGRAARSGVVYFR
jgi:hypothetical protein